MGWDAKILARNGTRIGWIMAAVLLALLVAAWIDGGKEPLHTIERSVDVPETAR